MLRTRCALAYNHRAVDKDGRFQRCFLMLGVAAYFATKGVQKVSVRRIIRMVVSEEVPVHNSMTGKEPEAQREKGI